MPSSPSKRSVRSAARSPHAHPDLIVQHQRAVAFSKSSEPDKITTVLEPDACGFLRVWMVVAFFLIAGTALPVTVHTLRHGFNPLQASLALFLILNVLICMWEISLGLHIK
jgi:hypothetical protein